MDRVTTYFLEQGCQLLEPYTGCMTPMRYICKCGREGKTSWNNFTRGRRCGYCHPTGRKKKWTIEELKEIYQAKGCKLLEPIYVNAHKPMKFECRCGKEHYKSLHEFRFHPQCLDCYKKSRSGENHHAWVDGRSLKRNKGTKKPIVTASYVESYFTEQGCKLLSEYCGSSQRLLYVCRCGKEATTIWSNFLKGKRCGTCGTKRSVKFTVDEIKQLFVKEGCEFLDDCYINNTTLHNFRCSCGQISSIKFQYFQRGVRCSECKKKKRSGENHFAWKVDRESLLLTKKFRKRVYGFLDRCRRKFNTEKEGHSHEILGYTPEQLKNHVFNHPNWDAVKNLNWHLDHIFPIEAFLLYGITDFAIINALDNLQPILQIHNNKKKDKYNKEDFVKWLKAKGIDISII